MDEEEEESLQLQRTILPLQGRYYHATGTTGILPTDLRESPLLEVRYYRLKTGTTGPARACEPNQGIFPCILSSHLTPSWLDYKYLPPPSDLGLDKNEIRLESMAPPLIGFLCGG